MNTTAPERLADAQDPLQTAQQAWKDNGDKSGIDHDAYFAQRYSETVIETAKYRQSAAKGANAARVMTLPGTLFATDNAALNAGDAGGQRTRGLPESPRRPDRHDHGLHGQHWFGSAHAALSEARANSVKSALVGFGIEASRIQTKGVGPANLVATNATAEGRQQNRRVEVAIDET